MTSVDVAVVGRGMVGAAAARHLVESGVSTALIGPDEPVDRFASLGPFSSHADEGRITRIADPDLVWSELASRSIVRYGEIIRRSGIGFHASCGLVVSRANVDSWIDTGLIWGGNIRRIDESWLREHTGIRVDNGLPLAYEGGAAGYVQPRRLVEAQTRLAADGGAVVVREPVDKLTPIAGGYAASGAWGEVRADRVLLATGAFGRQLLDGALALQRRRRTAVMIEMSDAAPLPSLILASPPDDRLESIYWVPPLPYPDGAVRLKIGGTLRADTGLDTDADLLDWFHGDGDAAEVEALTASFRALLPQVTPGTVITSPCVVTRTPTGYPFIGWVDDHLAVAIGGNGAAAKSSDEIGRLAASLFSAEGWTDRLDASLFTPQLL